MPAARTIAILGFTLLTACTGLTHAPPVVMVQLEPLRIDPSLAGPPRGGTATAERSGSAPKEQARIEAPPPVAESAPPVTESAPAVALPRRPVAPPSVVETVPPVTESAPAVALPRRPVALPVKAPAMAGALAVASEPSRTNEKPPAAATKLEAPLDIASLKTRLRETNAIGVLTKLALKNQVDDLLKQFRAHYASGQSTGVTSLRQPYNMLVLKVLALVQDSDPTLARTISASREAIWGILADREEFNSAT